MDKRHILNKVIPWDLIPLHCFPKAQQKYFQDKITFLKGNLLSNGFCPGISGLLGLLYFGADFRFGADFTLQKIDARISPSPPHPDFMNLTISYESIEKIDMDWLWYVSDAKRADSRLGSARWWQRAGFSRFICNFSTSI